MPQKINPKNESKSELIKLSMSEKNGITSAMMNAKTQVVATMAVQVTHALAVLE